MYEHLIFESLIHTIKFGTKTLVINKNALRFFSQTLDSLDKEYDTNFKTIPTDGLILENFEEVPDYILECCKKIDQQIRFLMDPRRQLIELEDAEHGHDWNFGNLICDECSNSPSYIGIEVYELCELASLVSLKVINLSQVHFERLLNAESIVDASFKVNSNI